ncbi:MAG: hypothetical protein ACRCZ0_10970 [Cetobacterium sp.]
MDTREKQTIAKNRYIGRIVIDSPINLFEKGQRVWTVGRGWGEVIRIDTGKLYPVVVIFDTGKVYSYTTCGKSSIDEPCFRELFFREVYIPKEVCQYECKDNVDVEIELKVRIEEVPADTVDDLIEYSYECLLDELMNKISDETDVYGWKRLEKISFVAKQVDASLPKVGWRAEKSMNYFMIDGCGAVVSRSDHHHDDSPPETYLVGNYFQTEEEAMKSKFYKVFHDKK